jgi:hypothetical protein
MQKASILFLILFITFSGLLFAQDNNEPEVEPDWNDYKYDLYSKGDQTFSISFGVGFPIAFINQGEKVEKHNIEPPIGGTGTLSYVSYLSSRFFSGAELSLLFLPTVAENTVFITSLGARFGTQFIWNRFEFPVFVSLGMTLQTYLDFNYFGYYMKAGGCALFRATNEWSFGLMSNLCWFPQWTKDKAKNVDGIFVDLSLIARYHF